MKVLGKKHYLMMVLFVACNVFTSASASYFQPLVPMAPMPNYAPVVSYHPGVMYMQPQLSYYAPHYQPSHFQPYHMAAAGDSAVVNNSMPEAMLEMHVPFFNEQDRYLKDNIEHAEYFLGPVSQTTRAELYKDSNRQPLKNSDQFFGNGDRAPVFE